MRMRAGKPGGGKGPLVQTEKTGTLAGSTDQTLFQPAVVYDARGYGDGGIAATITGDHQRATGDYTTLAVTAFDTTQITSPYNQSQIAPGLPCHSLCAGADAPSVVMTLQSFGEYVPKDTASTLQSRDHKYCTDLVANRYRVRRLTPLECERLQGFPDGWTDITTYTDAKGRERKTTDSVRYRALGNTIALPPWRFVLGRVSGHLPQGATLGSLFDGIGGFPYLWELLHGRGTALWASEIEPFPMAVTRRWFGE